MVIVVGSFLVDELKSGFGSFDQPACAAQSLHLDTREQRERIVNQAFGNFQRYAFSIKAIAPIDGDSEACCGCCGSSLLLR
jgi:hypothetical protein